MKFNRNQRNPKLKQYFQRTERDSKMTQNGLRKTNRDGGLKLQIIWSGRDFNEIYRSQKLKGTERYQNAKRAQSDFLTNSKQP